MSTHDLIDLDAIAQVIFNEKTPKFLNSAYFWMITDQDNQVLSCSSHENVKRILNSIKIPPKSDEIIFSTIELVPFPHSHIAIALEVNCFKMTINNQIIYLKIYNTIKNTNIKFKVFKSNLSTRKDGFYNILDFTSAIERLRTINPLELLTSNEWVVAWLIIHGLTNSEISCIMNISVNTVKNYVTNVLVNKLKLFNRYLLSDVGFTLNWDCFVPLSLINTYCIKKHTRDGWFTG
ncbi:helix-turn-helix domain-containing protein [Providencia alcalifaciens]|uniref:helix-turn-helix domain-containing protein n=1 Tax=Providencia alcalifaciens TaxID=126385 RepID=UPI001CC77B2C|nr:hypothetical protein NVI2019_OGMBKCAO_04065 [Providencia alcalifaciens]CAG9436885.1 hypothetical protein NVI2019_KOLGMIGM_04106 [Providencia alcalifaciens]CAG9436891.1 hypothetical protein NVI2019_PLFLNFOB_04104 [Providencia alcalifaciens]CAG9436913.1 hypothetical protein NVI2019_ANGEOOBF_04105 [Providencia alcalifaciens]CAG9437614.1 hypothetical protein NVI2019_OHEONHNH_04104 [Providencia alcalifaciens]